MTDTYSAVGRRRRIVLLFCLLGILISLFAMLMPGRFGLPSITPMENRQLPRRTHSTSTSFPKSAKNLKPAGMRSTTMEMFPIQHDMCIRSRDGTRTFP